MFCCSSILIIHSPSVLNNIFLSEPPLMKTPLSPTTSPCPHIQTYWALKTTQKIWPFENKAATMSFHYFLLIAAWKNFLVHFLSYEVFICIKFLGKSSIQTKKQLNEVFQTRPKNIKFNVIFKSSNRLKIYFRLNDNILHAINSTVIYKYKCKICKDNYITETKCKLLVGHCKHMRKSVPTSKLLRHIRKKEYYWH